MISPVSGEGNGQGMLPPASQYGQNTLIQLTQQMVKLLQQLPYGLGKVQQNGLSTGMRRGAFSTGG